MGSVCHPFVRNWRGTLGTLSKSLSWAGAFGKRDWGSPSWSPYEEIEVATIAIDKPSKSEIKAHDLETVVYPFQSEDLQRLREERLSFSAIFLLTLMSMGSIDTTEQHFEWPFAQKVFILTTFHCFSATFEGEFLTPLANTRAHQRARPSPPTPPPPPPSPLTRKNRNACIVH